MTAVELKDLLGLQARVIWALVLRETRATFGTSQLGYLWALITPLASLAILVGMWTLIGRRAPFGTSTALFFATGILILQFFTKCSSSLMKAFDANKSLLTYPVIKEVDALLARIILISATYMVISAVFLGAIIAWEHLPPPARLDQVFAAFFATAAFGFGFGTLNAVLYSLWHSWERVETILTRPLLFVSAVFYNPSHLPPWLLGPFSWNPVMHLIEWMRYGIYADYNSLVLDRAYVMSVSLLLILLGLAGERFFRKRRFNT